MSLSAKDAAEQVGMSKQGIIKAIRSGKLSAAKDDNGEWKIDPAELFRVYDAVNPANSNQNKQVSDSIQVVNGVSSGEIELLRELVQDLKEDKNRLLGIIEEQAANIRLLTDQRPQEKRSFWSWLAGKS